MSQPSNNLSLDQVIVKVTDMVSYDNNANKLAKKAGLNINYVSWEDCARNKGSCWGPCISDMTLKVNNSCMPVIRKPNFSDVTWDVDMNKIPIVIGNHNKNKDSELQTISLKDYLTNFSDFMSNDYYKNTLKKQIDLTSQKESKDSHVIMSSQACFLPIKSGQSTKFNVALFNYQSLPRNPSVLVIVSTSKGTSAQIIEGKEQYLLFNNNGKKADFIGERVSDHRKKKGQIHNINDKNLSKQEKQDNVIVIVQVPLKNKKSIQRQNKCGMFDDMAMNMNMNQNQIQNDDEMKMKECSSVNVEAAMVKISERTKPVCICNKELSKYQVQFAYNGAGVNCDICKKSIKGKETLLYHCSDGKKYPHLNGYDLCIECGEKQLNYDELRGLLDDDNNYILERNEDYPIRVTLQYYKSTDNGLVNKEIMDDIVKQLASSQKQADFMGSLVTEYNPNRPNEWIKNDDIKENIDMEYKEIRNGLKECCGDEWNIYYKKFMDEEVKDNDLDGLSMDDLKELIPKIGPRNRFKKWMDLRKLGDINQKPIIPKPMQPKPTDPKQIANSFVGKIFYEIQDGINPNGVYISTVNAISDGYRALYPGDAMTMDWRPNRLNIHLERGTNRITQVTWG